MKALESQTYREMEDIIRLRQVGHFSILKVCVRARNHRRGGTLTLICTQVEASTVFPFSTCRVEKASLYIYEHNVNHLLKVPYWLV